jgi:choline-sulfatase
LAASYSDPMTRPAATRRLNFVVILTDDQGRWAMPHRMPELVMPNLQQFLMESLELDQMYCASPVCSPSRASMLTGRMPSAHGVHDWLIGDRHPGAFPDRYLEGQPTTPEVLERAGYQCALSGKWHVGDSRWPAPGFSFWYAHRYGGGPYYNAPIWRDGEPMEEPTYFTEAVAHNAVEFLSTRDRRRPFYLQVNFTAPHHPWIDNHPRELVELYAGTGFPSVPREDPHPWVAPRQKDFAAAFAEPHPHLAGYCASLTAVDAALGRIRAVLDEQSIADQTVVIYLSDNGFSCGHHGVWGKGNGTLPLNFWDNSVRVPCVVHLPGGARGVSDALLSTVSMHRTICDLAQVEAPADDWHSGESFARVLWDGNAAGEEFVFVTSEYGGARMITDGRVKLVERLNGPGEFYDLGTDPGERSNRFGDQSLRTQQEHLSRLLSERFSADTRPGASGWHRPVTGFGQIHPVSRGLPGSMSYAQGPDDSDAGV